MSCPLSFMQILNVCVIAYPQFLNLQCVITDIVIIRNTTDSLSYMTMSIQFQLHSTQSHCLIVVTKVLRSINVEYVVMSICSCVEIS